MKIKLLFILFLASVNSFGQYTLIPDANFEKKLIALGIDSGATDGKVLTSNISSLTSLKVNSSLITDLTGIQDFVALQTLDCSGNRLTTLDISQNLALTSLKCHTNSAMSTFDISKNLNLKTLECGNGTLTTLDVTKNLALTDLRCWSANLTTLDVTKNLALKVLVCYVNQLTTIDVSNNIALDSLQCMSNKLVTLDLSKNVNLKRLDCTNNKLVSLNLKNGNNSKLEANFSRFHYNPDLTCIQVDDKIYSDANWANLKDATASYNTDCSPSYTLIPDSNFEDKLIALGIDSGVVDGKVLTSKISSLTSLDVSSSSIIDLTGIQDFVALQILNCSSNQFTSLDLSENIALTSLDCSSNKLITLDVSKNINLKRLNCSNNKLVSINLKNGNNSKLESDNYSTFLYNPNLVCIQVDEKSYSDANWSKLKDVTASYSENCSPATDLITVPNYVANNGLIAYYPFNGNARDESGNQNIATINGATLTADKEGNLNSAYSFDGSKSYIDVHIPLIPKKNSPRTISGWFKSNSLNYSGNNEGCIFNYGSLSNAQRFSLSINSKGDLENVTGSDFSNNDFSVNNFNYLNGNWYFFAIIYDGTKTSLFINGTFVMDKAVDLNTISLDNIFRIGKRISGDTINEYFKGTIDEIGIWNRVLTQQEITNLFNKKNKNPTPPKGITNVPDKNFEKKLISIGLDSGTPDGKVYNSNVRFLLNLNIANSSISDLTGIQDFVALQTLMCAGNQLTDMNINKNTTLTNLNCSSNLLNNLDVSNNIVLDSLQCSSNKLVTLDVSKNVNLKRLDCSSNKLVSLNLKNGNNSKLEVNFSRFNYNPDLTCIQVDDKTYADANWANLKDATASYSSNCPPPSVVVSGEFEDKLIALGIDTDGKNGSVLLSSITNVTSIDISNSGITNLSGIEYFTDLETLICKGNSLTTINLSSNTALKYLDCSNNPLTTLDVSKNILLTELYCDGVVSIINKMSNAKTSAATSLTALDLSNNLFLTKLSCSNNQLTSLDVSKNTLLTDINCSNNSLQNLNVNNGNNTKMLNVNFKSNSSLSCIKVDDEVYSNVNWSGAKDATAIYSKTACTLGIEDVVFDKISIYPNPVKGQLHIDNIALEKVTVYDALGKLVKITKFTNASLNNTIDLSGLPKGIYYLYLESEENTVIRKIVVE